MIETNHKIRKKITWILGPLDPSMLFSFWVWCPTT